MKLFQMYLPISFAIAYRRLEDKRLIVEKNDYLPYLLFQVYPSYVNYFDMGQSLLLKLQETNPDFRNFLIKCFNEPQSLKQNLEALLLRPVQRLPSLLLLLKGICAGF